MTLLTFPAYTDDIGDYQSGTIMDAAFLDSIKDSIDTLIHHASYPTVTPEDTIEEIGRLRDWSTVTPLGTNRELESYLKVEHNADGSHNLPATVLTTATLAEAMGPLNLVRNSKFHEWQREDKEPSGWTLSGASATVVKTGEGESDTTRKIGRHAVLLTSAAADAKLAQAVIPTTEWTKYDFEEGNKVVVGCWVYTANDSASVKIEVDDGNQATESSNPTNGAWTLLTATHTISAAATSLTINLKVAATSKNAYFSGAFLVFSDVAPSRYIHAIDSHRIAFDAFRNGFDVKPSSRSYILEDEFFSGASASGTIGTTGWELTQTGTGTLAYTGTAEHPGILQATTGAVTNDRIVLSHGRVLPASFKRARFVIAPGGTITSYRCVAGLSIVGDLGDVDKASIEGAFFYFDTGVSANWKAFIDNSTASAEDQDTGVAAGASTWVVLDIERNSAGIWRFFINGNLVHTSAIDLDSGDTFYIKVGVEALSNAARLLNVDYISFEGETGQRFD